MHREVWLSNSTTIAGVGLKHLTGDIKKMLARIMSIDQNNYPEMLGHTCIINAPGVFKLVWSAIKGFIDPKTQEKIEVTAIFQRPTPV